MVSGHYSKAAIEKDSPAEANLKIGNIKKYPCDNGCIVGPLLPGKLLHWRFNTSFMRYFSWRPPTNEARNEMQGGMSDGQGLVHGGLRGRTRSSAPLDPFVLAFVACGARSTWCGGSQFPMRQWMH